MVAFVHPVTKAPMRGYDARLLGEQMKELKEKLSMHGRPGHPSYKEPSKMLTQTSNSSSKSAGIEGQKGNFVNAFVADDVQPGDVIELKAGSKTVRVIVEAVENSA